MLSEPLRHIRFVCLLLLIPLVGAGCTGTYDGRYVFQPKPAVVDVVVDQHAGPIRTLATITGLRRAESETGEPASIEVRMRIENPGPAAVELEPNSLSLVAGNLAQFPEPSCEPDHVVTIAAEESADLLARFPFPENRYPADFDLAGLSLSWTLVVGDARARGSASFERRVRYYNDPFGPHYHFGIRFGHFRGYGYDPWCW